MIFQQIMPKSCQIISGPYHLSFLMISSPIDFPHIRGFYPGQAFGAGDFVQRIDLCSRGIASFVWKVDGPNR